MSSDLYRELCARMMVPDSKRLARIFEILCDETDTRLLLAMPGTPAQLAAAVGRPVDKVEAACRELYQKGLAFKSFKGGSLGYKMCRNLIQFHDATILWTGATQEFLDLWQRFMEEEWPDFARLIVAHVKKPFTRVIPVQRSLEIGRRIQQGLEDAIPLVDAGFKTNPGRIFTKHFGGGHQQSPQRGFGRAVPRASQGFGQYERHAGKRFCFRAGPFHQFGETGQFRLAHDWVGDADILDTRIRHHLGFADLRNGDSARTQFQLAER